MSRMVRGNTHPRKGRLVKPVSTTLSTHTQHTHTHIHIGHTPSSEKTNSCGGHGLRNPFIREQTQWAMPLLAVSSFFWVWSWFAMHIYNAHASPSHYRLCRKLVNRHKRSKKKLYTTFLFHPKCFDRDSDAWMFRDFVISSACLLPLPTHESWPWWPGFVLVCCPPCSRIVGRFPLQFRRLRGSQ